MKTEDKISLNQLYKDISRKALGGLRTWESVKNRVSHSILPKLPFLVSSEEHARICKLLQPATETSSSEKSDASDQESEESNKNAEKREEEAIKEYKEEMEECSAKRAHSKISKEKTQSESSSESKQKYFLFFLWRCHTT